MKKVTMLFILLVSYSAFAGQPFTKPQIVTGEGYEYVNISLTDMNHLYCPQDIKFVTYSKEKNMNILRKGQHAMIKVLPRKIVNEVGAHLEHQVFPREAFVECGGKVFSLMLVPKKELKAQTIILDAPEGDIIEVMKYETSQDFVKLILDMMKQSYQDQIPRGFKSVNIPHSKTEFEELTLEHANRFKGNRYGVDVYHITAITDIELNEGMFVRYTSNPAAIALAELNLRAGDKTRMFVVRYQEESDAR